MNVQNLTPLDGRERDVLAAAAALLAAAVDCLRASDRAEAERLVALLAGGGQCHVTALLAHPRLGLAAVRTEIVDAHGGRHLVTQTTFEKPELGS